MKGKVGRPSRYSEDVMDELCERLSKGEPMAAICRDEHMPAVPTINLWRSKDPAIDSRVARARDDGFDALALDCLNIADDNGRDLRVLANGSVVTDSDVVQRSKLRIETRLKLLACWDPKRYGNKVDVTSGGNPVPAPMIAIPLDQGAE